MSIAPVGESDTRCRVCMIAFLYSPCLRPSSASDKRSRIEKNPHEQPKNGSVTGQSGSLPESVVRLALLTDHQELRR